MNNELTMEEINEELFKLEKALESSKEMNRVETHEAITRIHRSLRKLVADLSKMLTGQKIRLPIFED